MHERRDYSVNRRLFPLLALAMAIGAASTLTARALHDMIQLFTNVFFFQSFSLAPRSPADNHLGGWVVFLPVLGGLIVGLVARYGSDKIRGHGIPEALEAILFGKSKMSPRIAVLKPLASSIAIGSGGPFGAEGPIIMTGGSLGSLVAQYFHLTANERKSLLVAGACAGMTAIFGTPVAALLLAIEMLLFEFRPRSLLPVALACAVAGFLRPMLFSPAPLFPLQTAIVGPDAFVACVLAGLAAGAFAALLGLSLYRVEDVFSKLRLHWMWWPALGGIAVGIGGYIEPRALGIGYDVIADLLNNRLAVGLVLGLITVKATIWLIALASGTSGGVLAPLLMIGAGIGIALSTLLPGAEPQLWALACMAAVLGSTLGAPLTAVVFALELTHDSNALLPVLLTTMVAYGFNVLTMRRSIMTEKIARRGRHIYREYGLDPLERVHVGDLFDDSITVPSADLCELIAAGIVVVPGDTARCAAGHMAAHGVTRLPVVADQFDLRFVGVLELARLLEPNRVAHHDETFRERLR